jgi:gamma-glutamylcyclotransferase (GGCT)/AIG2-like uncharacterized protein YtfP
MVLVWQYGSNMDEDRINDKKRLYGKAKFVQLAINRGHRLSFTHTNIHGVGTADIMVDPADYVIGCLYEIPDNMLKVLDRIEGVNSGAYKRDEQTIIGLDDELKESSKPFRVITYVVVNKEKNPKTDADYANHILRGIIIHRMGKPYYEKVRKIIIENSPSIQEGLLDYPNDVIFK